MEDELDELLVKIAQLEMLRELQQHFFNDSLELLEEMFGDGEIMIEDWEF